MNRRTFLSSGFCALPWCTPIAWAQTETKREQLMREVSGGAVVNPGRVIVDTPTLADNGHSIPVRIIVESPMTPEDYVQRVTILAERNPRPIVASFMFSPASGRAEVMTRIRLADIQDVVAVAQLANGTYWYGQTKVIVTELACLEEVR